MKKLIIILLLWPLMCYAQFGESLFSTNNQKLIEQAVRNGFVVVEQTYQLEDSVTHKRYGLNKGEIFGKASALGVRVGTDLLVDGQIQFPWENDANFERFRIGHFPVINSSSLIELDNSDTTRVAIQDSIISITKSLISLPDSSVKIKGFTIENVMQPTEGWLIWVTSDMSLLEWDGSPQVLSIYKKVIDFSPAAQEYEIEAPQTRNHVWGGVFVIPRQTEIGQLTFNLAGILVNSKEGQWTLEAMAQPEKESVEPTDELTPVEDQ